MPKITPKRFANAVPIMAPQTGSLIHRKSHGSSNSSFSTSRSGIAPQNRHITTGNMPKLKIAKAAVIALSLTEIV